MIGRTTYVGFFIDWGFDTVSSIAYGVILTTSGSLFMGVSYYIHGMALDMRIRMRDLDARMIADKMDQRQIQRRWMDYISIIRLHNDIIE